ncbi:hypothetical protein PUN28_004189 [Cardiocondyla obscurior]|uniref:Uncharacterized protein n=1 Tax=Cardiocondyla obscurior TaxID=286306 RepID=A0AAW2GPY1_9HYME
MYLARDQSHGNGFGKSRSAVDEDVIENEQRFETISRQSQLESQSSTLTRAQDRETDPMRQHPSAWKLHGGKSDDDDDDDEQNEGEQSNDDFSTATEGRGATPRVMLVGWDNFRTKLLLFLIVCLLVWASVFFPLLGT